MLNNYKYLFTDDKATRRVAELYGLEPHGTAGIVARAYREEILTYREVKRTMKILKDNSTLYIDDPCL